MTVGKKARKLAKLFRSSPKHQPDSRFANKDPFQPRALEDATKQIRLLQFLPEATHDCLACSLTSFGMNSLPVYVAISYEWGSSEDSGTLLVDGERLTITKNCHYALSQVWNQYRERSVYVWVDSICVNQGSADEKGHQVPLMASIYDRASKVYACVGEHGYGSKFLMRDLNDMHTTFNSNAMEFQSKNDRESQKQLVWEWVCRCISHCPVRKRPLSMTTKSLHGAFSFAFKEFGDRPFWSRLWIVQETWLARDLQILCGWDRISCDAVTLLWKFRASFEMYSSYGWNNEWYMNQMWFVLSQSRHLDADAGGTGRSYAFEIPCTWRLPVAFHGRSNLAMDIITAMTNFRDLGCSDFHDRVFAIQGLVAWPKRMEPLVSGYKLSLLELFLDTLSRLRPNLDYKGAFLYLLFEAAESLGLDNYNGELTQLRKDWTKGASSGAYQTILHNEMCMTIRKPAVMTVRELSADTYSCSPELRKDVNKYTLLQEEQRAFMRNVRDAKKGKALIIDHEVVGRIPDKSNEGDVLVRLESTCCWLVLRQSRASDSYDVVGIAVVSDELTVDSWEYGLEFDIFLSPQDAVVLSWYCHRFEKNDPVCFGDCLATNFERDRLAPYVTLRKESRDESAFFSRRRQ